MRCSNLDLFTASDHLPSYLLSSKGASYKVNETPFQDALGTSKPRWEWLEESIDISQKAEKGRGVGYPGSPDFHSKLMSAHLQDTHFEANGTRTQLTARPELEIFGLAMVGGGRVFGAAHPHGKVVEFRCHDQIPIELKQIILGKVWEMVWL